MGRTHSPKGQVVRKKEMKLEAVFAAMPRESSFEDYAEKFKEMYPADWDNIVHTYMQHERRTLPGKHHPMPKPMQYLLNMVKNYYRKTNKVVARSKREAQPEAVMEYSQPEAQPEVVTEHPQPEVVTEHPQPPA